MIDGSSAPLNLDLFSLWSIHLDWPKPAQVKTPILVLGAARDNMICLYEIEATARAYHTKAEIIADVAHNSMLELRWQSVAGRILAWLNELPDPSVSTQVAEFPVVMPL